MKAKLSATTSKSSKGSPSHSQQQERQSGGGLGPGNKHGGPFDSRGGSANGPAALAGSGSGSAPADQRHLLPPLTPEEMRRQYAGGFAHVFECLSGPRPGSARRLPPACAAACVLPFRPRMRWRAACSLSRALLLSHRAMLALCQPGGQPAAGRACATASISAAVAAAGVAGAAPCSLSPPAPLALRSCPAEPLPLLRDVPPGEKQALFVRKLHLCAFSFDFADPTAHVREKEVKRQTLLELVDYVNSGSGKFNEQVGAAPVLPSRAVTTPGQRSRTALVGAAPAGALWRCAVQRRPARAAVLGRLGSASASGRSPSSPGQLLWRSWAAPRTRWNERGACAALGWAAARLLCPNLSGPPTPTPPPPPALPRPASGGGRHHVHAHQQPVPRAAPAQGKGLQGGAARLDVRSRAEAHMRACGRSTPHGPRGPSNAASVRPAAVCLPQRYPTARS